MLVQHVGCSTRYALGTVSWVSQSVNEHPALRRARRALVLTATQRASSEPAGAAGSRARRRLRGCAGPCSQVRPRRRPARELGGPSTRCTGGRTLTSLRLLRGWTSNAMYRHQSPGRLVQNCGVEPEYNVSSETRRAISQRS